MQKADRILKGLNEQQIEAVTYFDSPLLVVAGAGSGKTKVITHKIAYMVKKFSFNPERILAVTFTNKAAEEMKVRVEKLLGKSANVNVMTFHAFCLKLLKAHSARISYRANFFIVDTDDRRTLIKKIIKELNLDPEINNPQVISSTISSIKNGKISATNNQTIEKILEVYNEKLRELNAFDFDDLLIYAGKLLTENDDIRDRYSKHFQYVLIDEYQDTNQLQYEIAKAITLKKGNICAVGDEDQCIYTWRGANITNIMNFDRDFANAKIVKLEKNYRCSSTILKAANAVISRNKLRRDKKLYTENPPEEPIRLFTAYDSLEEASFIASTIKHLLNRGFSAKDIAVFYRTNYQSRVIEDSLRRNGINYQIIGGIRFFERKEIKDILAYIRFSFFKEDEISLFRILNTPKRFLGESVERKLKSIIERGKTAKEALAELINSKSVNSRQREGLKDLIETIRIIENKLSRLNPYEIAMFVVTATGYEAFLRKEFPEDWTVRMENIRELGNTLAEFSEKTGLAGEELIYEFINTVTLHQEQDEMKNNNDAISLMTVHTAKGLEFPVVFITGLEEGIFPHIRSISNDDIEEERRLFYVAMTRAKKLLILTCSGRRRISGNYKDARPSRFIKEIPRETLKISGTAKVQHKDKKVQTFNTGMAKLVFHEKFGRGVIRRIDGIGDKAKVTVIFENFGEKTIIRKFLKILG